MRRFRMSRLKTSLISLFLPIPALLLIALLISVLPQLSGNVLAFGVLVLGAGVIAMRVHFGSWYARDKGRSESWGLLAAFGIMGWLVLWSLRDDGFQFR